MNEGFLEIILWIILAIVIAIVIWIISVRVKSSEGYISRGNILTHYPEEGGYW